MQPFIGSAETIAPAFWRLIPRYMPDGRVVIVRRPVAEVVESILKQGIIGIDRPKLINDMKRLDDKLNQAEVRLPNCISVNFDELGDPEVCKIVFEHCLGMAFNLEWWKYWDQINVQVHFDAIVRYIWTHLGQLGKLANSARHQMMIDLTSQKPATSQSGLEITEESFIDSWPDAADLMNEHCLAIGQAADEWTRNNIPLMEAMDRSGCLQVLAARANGRLFGYLVSVLGPSTESLTERSAQHLQFFASPEWPGAGLRLHREALSRLKAKGISEVVLRSWLGPGKRIETLYRRLGAELDGQLYRIKLG